MSFYSFQLARIASHVTRSAHTDIDILSFGVSVERNGVKQDHGHGVAVLPIFMLGHGPYVVEAEGIYEAGEINGHQHSARFMSDDWTIGPLEINPSDRVEIVFSAINTGDSNLKSETQQKFDEFAIGVLNIYYSALLGEFVSSLGLTAVADYLGVRVGEACAAILANPVGFLLGYKPAGPCNGPVFEAYRSYRGADLERLGWIPGAEPNWNHKQLIPIGTHELIERYTDSAYAKGESCGASAQTDVTLRFTRYEQLSVDNALGVTAGRDGLRQYVYRDGGSLKRLLGVRM